MRSDDGDIISECSWYRYTALTTCQPYINDAHTTGLHPPALTLALALTPHSPDQVSRSIQPKHAQILPRLELVHATSFTQKRHGRASKWQEGLEVLVIPADAQVVVADDLSSCGLQSAAQQAEESAFPCTVPWQKMADDTTPQRNTKQYRKRSLQSEHSNFIMNQTNEPYKINLHIFHGTCSIGTHDGHTRMIVHLQQKWISERRI